MNIILQPPFLFRTDDPDCPTRELEPLVSIRDASKRSKSSKSNQQQGQMDAQQAAEVLCTLEDICNISVVENEDATDKQCR